MIENAKALWARFKVQISFVAGCLVVATSMGTCSFDPSATSEDASGETETTEQAETTDATETATATEAATASDVTTTESTTEAATTADVTTVTE